MSDFEQTTATLDHQIKCKGCGAFLNFKPGTEHLVCEYCQADNLIEDLNAKPIEEKNFLETISNLEKNHARQELTVVKCQSCGASSTLQPNIASDNCSFCGTPLVVQSGNTCSQLKPDAVLPFRIDKKEAMGKFHQWVKGLWFAPNDLKHMAAHTAEKLKGVYLPYWTFDSDTYTRYQGMRGIYYYVTESYSTVENGKTVTKTRQVRKTRWTATSGYVSHQFDDVLISASHSLPDNVVADLEPWDLPELKPFNEQFLAGFVTETYQLSPKDGFEQAKIKMDDHICVLIKRDIGGDEQQILSKQTEHNHITFKHVLLPLWISSYRYKEKVFRFLINARTGEVKGERPYSAIKITLFVLLILALVGGLIYFLSQSKHS